MGSELLEYREMNQSNINMFAPGTCVQHHSFPMPSIMQQHKKGKAKVFIHHPPAVTPNPGVIIPSITAAEYERKNNDSEARLVNETFMAEKLTKDLEIQLSGEKRKSEKIARWLMEYDEKRQGLIEATFRAGLNVEIRGIRSKIR